MSAVIEGKGGFRAWLNKRLPVDQFVEDQLTGYYAPKNFNVCTSSDRWRCWCSSCRS